MTQDDPPPATRVADLLAEVLAGGSPDRWPSRLAESCRDAVGAAGIGLSLADADGPRALLAATDGIAQTAEDLQFTLGEGPCHEAVRSGEPAISPLLAREERWPQFAREASRAGIVAVHSVPLQVGALRIGVLDAYTAEPGRLSPDREALLRDFTDAATTLLLLLDGPPGASPEDGLAQLADIRPVVHQAAGMVAVQLGVGLADALMRLRAHAFASGHALRDVAQGVVDRRMTFDDSDRGVTTTRPASGRVSASGTGPVDDPAGDVSDAAGADRPGSDDGRGEDGNGTS